MHVNTSSIQPGAPSLFMGLVCGRQRIHLALVESSGRLRCTMAFPAGEMGRAAIRLLCGSVGRLAHVAISGRHSLELAEVLGSSLRWPITLMLPKFGSASELARWAARAVSPLETRSAALATLRE